MPCYHPIPASQGRAWQGDHLRPTRPRLNPPAETVNLELPCGKCLGCLTAHATDWGHRAENEASQWEHNCFLTLTYTDKELPQHGQLEPEALRDFFKRLRRYYDRMDPRLLRHPDHGLRYLASGEYGEHNGRPHYHACLFNCNFDDARQVAGNSQQPLLQSELLQRLWPQGIHRLGNFTGATATYVAKYTVKKQQKVTPHGVHIQQKPFLRMSRHPAIDTEWIKKYKNDLQHGYYVTNGQKARIPRAYKTALRADDPAFHAAIVQRAADYAARRAPDGALRTKQQELDAQERIHINEAAKAARNL